MKRVLVDGRREDVTERSSRPKAVTIDGLPRIVAVTLVALGAAAGCESSRSGARGDANFAEHVAVEHDAAVPQDVAVQQDAASFTDRGVGPLRPVSLVTLDELAARGLLALASRAAIGGARRWISAQTFGRDSSRGPIVLYEQQGAGPWVPATIPATTHADPADLCAVSATEAYVAVIDRDGPLGPVNGRIFARAPGDAATFVEQTAPAPPAGYSLQVLALSCFSGGNLWAYGSVYPGVNSASQRPVIYHRSSTTADWESVSLPAEVPTASPYGQVAALIRADGSGYFAMFNASARQALFERLPDGSWRDSLVLGPLASVASLAGDPSGHAVGAIIAADAQYIELRQGTWSVVAATAFVSLRGASFSRHGLMLTGAARGAGGELRMTVAREPDFVPLDLGLEGTVSQVVFPTEPDRAAALVMTYGSPTFINAYEWVP